ncbi:regulatory protein RecX [Flavobacterium sp.]|uniref:regulatory protein RecX n=1 Tax=Flavobacterium sp. TaxID=239 RepID=UPI002629E751|nr:regulatory protein RecX [Flavobacterium sp.]
MQGSTHKIYTVEEAKRKLEHYCAYQERCHEEVVKKLRGMNMIPQAVDAVVDHLLEHNFLNEERFARSFARGRFRIKQWGKVRIVRELKARDISRYNIDAALKEIDSTDYLTTFYTLAEKQWNAIRETNIIKKKKKLFDFLMRKGYESNLIYEAIQNLANND